MESTTKILFIYVFSKPEYWVIPTEYLKNENIRNENFMYYGWILDQFYDGEYFLRSETMTREQALIRLLKR